MCPPDSYKLFRSFAFETPLPKKIIIFLKTTAPNNLISMSTSFIFRNKSSVAMLSLPRLLKISGSKSYFWLLNLRFQLLIDVCKKLYCGYFDFEVINSNLCSVAYAYFPTSSLTRVGILILYEELFLPYFLLKLSNSAFTADASATVTFPFLAMISLQHKISVFHSTH